MSEYSIFDIIGPVMIGPSSSHTAGAVRIGYFARKIAAEDIQKVIFYLHGSFAKTYAGHGTDRALLAGVMGFLPDDERIRDAFQIAQHREIAYQYEETDLGEVHPNTVKIEMHTASKRKWEIMGSSLGGGKVRIIQINQMEVAFEGEYTTLMTHHVDRPGVIAKITAILAEHNVNIAFMKLFRESKGSNARLIVETDQEIGEEVQTEILKNPDVQTVKVIQPI